MNAKNSNYPDRTRTDIPSLPASKKEQVFQEKAGPFEWWYRWTAPAIPPVSASLAMREEARRGRLASIVLLFVIALGVLAAPSIIIVGNPVAITSHFASIGLNLFALFFNKRGKVTAAGVLVVLSISLAFALSLITPIGVASLPLFELLVLPELVAVSLLPPGWVFVFAIIYSLFAWFDLTFLPHAPDLTALLKQFGYGLILEPVLVYLLVAVVTFLWVRSASQAIARADRAEEIVALEQREIERQQEELEQKQQLDLGIKQLLQTHVQVANGNFTARVPLTRENVLWQVAYSLNNLIARIQGYTQNVSEFQRAREHANQVAVTIHNAKHMHSPVQIERRGTFLDPIIIELNGTQVVKQLPSPSQSSQVRTQKFVAPNEKM